MWLHQTLMLEEARAKNGESIWQALEAALEEGLSLVMPCLNSSRPSRYGADSRGLTRSFVLRPGWVMRVPLSLVTDRHIVNQGVSMGEHQSKLTISMVRFDTMPIGVVDGDTRRWGN
jgi:hypothetical protein